MLFDVDDDTLYTALLTRDARYDGRVYVGVTSTGVFCRLTCPARKPKRANCRFHATIAACIAAGFRPCMRCHPMRPAAESDPSITSLLAALEDRPGHRWSEADVIALGHDPSTVRRAFKRHYGMTFLDIARHRRVRAGLDTLKRGEAVISAQLDAGYESSTAFRSAVARLLGCAPSALDAGSPLLADWIETPLGAMIAVASAHALHLLEFTDRKSLPREIQALVKSTGGRLGVGRRPPTDRIEAELAAYFDGRSAQFDTPLAPLGTPFQRTVWDQLRRVPAGRTRSYGEIAVALGRPSAARSVARANGANPIALAIPCHRVIGADGGLTGYGGGLWRKQKLIEIERRYEDET
jgi:AraC family transcriptional regulator of adaptative response/methylated-DNA-[protein]-cysteine methyltransferase